MFTKRSVVIGAGVLFYSLLAVSFLNRAAVLDRLFERLPQALSVILLTIAGPAALFAAGIQVWPAVVLVLAVIATFLGLARVAWRRSPETEWFAVWLICAALVWFGSGWLLVIPAV